MEMKPYFKLVAQLFEKLPVKSIAAGDAEQAHVFTPTNSVEIEVPFGRHELYREQVEAGAEHQAWAEFTVLPENLDETQAVARQLGCFIADANVSASKVQLFLILGEHRPDYQFDNPKYRFVNWLGRRFKDGANPGKSGLKRQRVLKLPGLSKGSAGGTVVPGKAMARMSKEGYTVHTVSTPAGKLRIAEIPAPHDSNDNDGLITQRGYEVLAELCRLGPIEAAATVQTLLVSSTGAIKFAGQVLTGEPTGDCAAMLAKAPKADIYIGTPSVDRNVSYKGKVAVRTNVWHEDEQNGLAPADGLQQATTVLGYLTPETVAAHANPKLSALVRQDQLSVFGQRHEPSDETDEDRTPMHKAAASLVAQIHRRFEAQHAEGLSKTAWVANGSQFAYADPRTRSAQQAYSLRSSVDNNQRGRHGGMPTMWLPGHWVKLMSPMFVGDCLHPVAEPAPGWATLVYRNPRQPWGLCINSADFGSVVWTYGLDGSDFDDKVTATLCVDADGNPWLLVLRRPSSPYGGRLLRISHEEAERYEEATGTPAMPLREGWQKHAEQCVAYAELPHAITMGPELEPIPASNEPADIMAAARRQAEQVAWTGRVSYLVGALSLSGLAADGAAKFVTSDLIDNAVEGRHDGQYVYDQFLNLVVDHARRGNAFFRPSVSVIERSIMERYYERYGEAGAMRYAPNPELEQLWQLLLRQASWTWNQHQLMANRRNGPYQWLTRETDESVAVNARLALDKVRSLWADWGRRKNAIPFGKQREEAIAAITATTLAAIESVVLQAYEASAEEFGYIPGTFIAALTQAQATDAAYWRKFSANKQPKRYDLAQWLPKGEQVAFYDRGELPPADPTWFARAWVLRGQSLELWDEVTVNLKDGCYYLYPDGAEETAQPIAQLGPEAQGIVGLYSEFLGFVPRKEGEPPVAAFRNSANDLESLTRGQLEKSREILQEKRAFA